MRAGRGVVGITVRQGFRIGRVRCFCLEFDPDPVFTHLWIRIQFQHTDPDGKNHAEGTKMGNTVRKISVMTLIIDIILSERQ